MEETIGYEALFSSEEWSALPLRDWDTSSLPEQDALRLAQALDDYELVHVADIGGNDGTGYWLHITDDRFGLTYQIGSHADYWDFLGYFCSHKQWPAQPLEEVA